jgi:hypothetical protein
VVKTKVKVTMAQSDPRPMPQPQAGTPRPTGPKKDGTRQMEGQTQPSDQPLAPQQGNTAFTDWASI